jgi:hypothetical protein
MSLILFMHIIDKHFDCYWNNTLIRIFAILISSV